MSQSFDLAQWYVHVLTSNPDTIMDWRCIHDTNKGIPAHNFRGTLRDTWATLVDYNARGYGIFVTINAMDGVGRDLNNVHHIRTHCVDLDDPLTSQDGYNRAIASYPHPHMSVQTSPGKYHVYWLVEPYTSNEYYSMIQRKLRQIYNGDKMVVDATRVLRVPGFYHLKAQPYMVTCHALYNGSRWPVQAIEATLQQVQVFDHVGQRAQLGDISLAAPSLEWLRYALHLLNPNDLDRSEWMSISAAFKQAGWTLAPEQQLLDIWNIWCALYEKNDLPENLKLWHSFRETEVGWAAFERRTPVKAYMMEYGLKNTPAIKNNGVVAQSGRAQVVGGDNEVVGSNPAHPTTIHNPYSDARDDLGDLLGRDECKIWFKDCYFIARQGQIFDKSGRFMNASQFNGVYGGKQFIITQSGKSTDEAWKAALRSTMWTIPKVDHTRFLPLEKPYTVIYDRLGRAGLNTYIPVSYDSLEGDISPFLDWLSRVLPVESDRKIFLDYMAHAVKFPGHKISWAPLIQSTEGVGKTIFAEIIKHVLGSMYVYFPKANDLVSSGSKFNAWMRGKLAIVVNEIKVDERRELIEILKPMITDKEIEVQAKGVDQEMEDNPANWFLFSNFKDAVPIHQNGRRYAIFFSALQSTVSILKAGLDKAYFDRFFDWLEKENGYRMITYWLLNHPIKKGEIPSRAPETSSHAEALRISRSPMQVAIEEAIEDGLQGFKGDYVSSLAVTRRMSALGVKSPSGHSIRTVLESMGYIELGRALKSYPMEDLTGRAIIYGKNPEMTLEAYSRVQGYD